LIPQPYAALRTDNLLWELRDEPLTLGMREGARNRATAERVRILISAGEYFLFVNPKIPYAPQYKKKHKESAFFML
jgi:hypothetical protein